MVNKLLAQILTRAPLTILEIDPLTTAIAHKRLRFYQSMGFHANPWAIVIRPIIRALRIAELLVLSYPQPIGERQYQQFARDLGHEVMGQVAPARRTAPGIRLAALLLLTIGVSFSATLLSP